MFNKLAEHVGDLHLASRKGRYCISRTHLKRPNPAQSKRFIEAAKALGLDPSGKAFERGIASAEDIDKAARHGLDFRMTSLDPIERLNLGPLPGFKLNWESIDAKTGLLGPFPASVQKLIDQGQHGLKKYTDEEVRRQTKERDRELVRSLRALGRI